MQSNEKDCKNIYVRYHIHPTNLFFFSWIGSTCNLLLNGACFGARGCALPLLNIGSFLSGLYLVIK